MPNNKDLVLPQLFLRSLGLHILWFVRSWAPGAHSGAPLGLRRIFFLLVLFPLFLGLQLLHWFGFLLDEVFFRSYRKAPVHAPVFISGIPRSGTTFVHRTLAAHAGNFTSFSTWEALLAPSIAERKLFHALGALDRACGRPLTRILHSFIARTTGAFNAVHEVNPSAPEEDYLALLPAGGCFMLCFAFPFSTRLQQLGALDQMPQRTRRKLLLFYRRLLQKHLYCAPEGARLLSKNAGFGSWAPELLKIFPDARIILCVREPVSALSSQLSALAGARRLFGADPDGAHTASLMTEIFAANYAGLRAFVERSDPAQVALINQSELRARPGALLAATVERLELDPRCDLVSRLKKLPPSPPSEHRHSASAYPVDTERIENCLDPEYRQMLRSEVRVSA
ncbi:MAG: sulfotransferase [Opitutales bacterium]